MIAPEFVELNEGRYYNPGIEDEYADQFYFYFDLELNDIDTSEPVTAKLQWADIGSEDWEDCPMLGESVLSAEFDGDDTSWSCEDLMFDIFTLEYKGEIGLMKQARILVEFTYLDGSEDSVSSTDLDSLFVYTGEYIHTVSSSYENGVISCTFRVDTGMVFDLTKLEMRQLTLNRYRVDEYYNMQDIRNDAEISEFAEDGTFTVTYTPADPLDPNDSNSVTVAFDYTDHNDFIYWYSAGFAHLDVPITFTAPTLDSTRVLQDYDGFSYIPISVTVADGTQYGDLTATLQYWIGSDYVLFEDDSGDMTVNSVSLSQYDSTASWVTDPYSDDCLIAELAVPDGYGFFRVALQYVDDTGATQIIYSEPFVVYQGTYVFPAEEESMEVGDGFFFATYYIDPDVVDPEKVDSVAFTATSIGGDDILEELEWIEIHADTGEVSVRGQISYALAGTDEYFIATVKLLYTDTEAGPVTVEWEAESSVEIEIEYGFGSVPPEVLSVEVRNLDSVFYVTFTLLMNDAEEVTARLYRAEGIDSYDYSECDSSYGTNELYHSIVSDPSEEWSTSPGDVCLSYDAYLEYGVPGLFYWFYIEFECTMPEDEVEYVYSDDVPAYVGSFFVEPTEYAVAAYNPVTQEFSSSWAINPELAPDLSKVSAESVVIVPGSDAGTEVELPTSCVSFNTYDWETYYEAYVFAEGVTLTNSSDWTLELTLSYNGERYTWTCTQPMQVASMVKALRSIKHNQNIPPMGPAGGLS